jgi:hypothetical protein
MNKNHINSDDNQNNVNHRLFSKRKIKEKKNELNNK